MMAMIFCNFNLYVLTYEERIILLEFFNLVRDPFIIAVSQKSGDFNFIAYISASVFHVLMKFYYVFQIHIGLENWNDKTMIRAITVEMFKDFKPSSYEMINNDYGIYDLTTDEESELFGGIMDKELDNLVRKDFQKGVRDLETNGKNIFLLELKERQNLDKVKDLLCAELNEIKKEKKSIKKEEKESCSQNLLNLFK